MPQLKSFLLTLENPFTRGFSWCLSYHMKIIFKLMRSCIGVYVVLYLLLPRSFLLNVLLFLFCLSIQISLIAGMYLYSRLKSCIFKRITWAEQFLVL